MAAFLSQDLAELTRQLSFAPRERRRRHLDNAERLYWNVAPERNYPLDFVVYQITGYRPDTTGENPTLVGEALRLDLLLLVERLSDTLDDRAEDYDPSPHELNSLSEHLGVSIKTLHRYRRQGLFARRLRFPDGRKRLAFLQPSVQRFLDARPSRVRRAGRFSRLDEPTRHRIITRARRIAGRVPVSAHRVARHLARKYDRSTETIRQLLLKHDRRDPRTAIFPDHTPPLTDKQQRIIHRAYHRGISAARLAERFGKARNAIYRALNRRRAKALRELNIRYVYSPTFDLPEADEVILGSAPANETAYEAPVPDATTPAPSKRAGAPADPADGLSPYLNQLYEEPLLDAQTEKALFARYNYLKYRAAQLRDKLDRYQPRATRLDQIETDLRRAVATKQRLVRANLRLVVSVARKHLGARRSADTQAMADLVSEGNLVLLEAIEHFDAGRGNRFSTYLTWSLMRRFAQSSERTAASAAPLATDARGGEYWPAALNPNVAAMEHAEELTHTLSRLLAELDHRERLIVTRHFGLDDGTRQAGEPQTLAQLAEELEISAERARQIEHRAIRKLRAAADRLNLPLPRTDDLPS